MFKIFISLVCVLFATQISAMQLNNLSMGREGPAFVEKGIQLQKVKYSDSERLVYAVMPGSPSSVMSSDGIYLYSEFNNACYELQIHQGDFPKTARGFKKMFKKLQPDSKIKEIKTYPQKKCKFVLEYAFKDTKGDALLGRIYPAAKGVYIALIKGDDSSFAEKFFNSVDIQR